MTALYERGAKKVYATARDPHTVAHPDAVPLALEVSDPASVAAAAAQAQDVTLLIDNAGGSVNASFLDSPVEGVRREFETNFYGPLLERNGGGHILNVHSVLSWLGVLGSYSASKAVLWSHTNSLRLDLKPRGIDVTGLHVGYVDTRHRVRCVRGPRGRPVPTGEGRARGRSGRAVPAVGGLEDLPARGGASGHPPWPACPSAEDGRQIGRSRPTSAPNCRTLRHSCISTSSAYSGAAESPVPHWVCCSGFNQ